MENYENKNDIQLFLENANIDNKLKKLKEISAKKKANYIKIKYKIENNEVIKLFGTYFKNKNKNICKIIFNNKKYELKDYFLFKGNKNKSYIEIKLTGILELKDLKDMFAECKSLYSLSNISKFDTKNIIDMSNLFYKCESLSILPKILPWDTSNVNDMSCIFSGCTSLANLPDISLWNLKNVTDIYGMFGGCKSLLKLPDISNWNISNVQNIGGLFNNCESLNSLPDISKWNTENVNDMKGVFYHCRSLLELQ